MNDHKNAKKRCVFVAGLSHETSASSPIPTTRRSFESFDYYRPVEGRPDEHCRTLTGYGSFVRCAEKAGLDIYASTYTWAQPSARTVRKDYESLRDEILQDLKSCDDVAMVLYFLHGSQMAQGYDDCEGDLLARTREVVGDDCFVGALLDLHTNVSTTMLESASALVACRNYPHTDFDERAEHLFDVGCDVIGGKSNPVSHFLRVPMFGMFYTTQPLMFGANEAAENLQQHPGVLSVSLTHGFTWSNTPDTGAGVVVVTDGENVVVDDAMNDLARLFFEARSESTSLRQSIGEILDEIEQSSPAPADKPFVIADCCDNPGGGAGCDSTFILDEILNRKLSGFTIGLLWDPLAVEFASDAGVGATLDIRIGGKTGPSAGNPLDVSGTVLGIYDGLSQHGLGFDHPMGRCVALDVAGNTVVLNTVRGQVFSPTCFTDCGVVLSTQRGVVVKSTQHFYDQFYSIAKKIFYCETPGSLSLSPDPEKVDRIRRPIWPLDDIAFDQETG